MDGKVIRPAGIHVGTHVRPDEKALVEEDARIFLLGIRGRPLGVEMMEMDILQPVTGLNPVNQCADQHMGDTGDTAQVDVVSAFYAHDGLMSRDILQLFHICTPYIWAKIALFFVFL